jgi:general secretion pathway protein L
MHVLAIDIGTYSIKYVSSFVDKRKTNHLDMSEVVVRDFVEDHRGISLTDAQVMIVQQILESHARSDSRIIFQAYNEMMTTRFLNLPVKSKKKADLMLPFQLEEDIPYALSEIHFGYRLESAKTQHFALVGLAREEIFDSYYQNLKEHYSLPNILTTEASVVENYFNQNALAGPFCVLDIGHKTTKAYFFYNSRLIVTHVSYFGGENINEMIARNYKIEPDEAIIYKHQNAFLLNNSQLSEVDESQREFALAMDKTFHELVADFLRWKIGFKVNYGLSLGHVYITGGTTNIRNIANYLTEKLETRVVLLETFDKIEGEKIDLNPKNKSKFALANMMAIGMKRKNRFINLLNGRFAQASSAEIPLHSFAFIGFRIAVVAGLFAISFMAERFFIERDIKKINSRISGLMKDPTLSIPGRLRRAIATNPKPVYDALVKKQRGIRQEINTVQAAIEIQALSPLISISQIAASTQTTLVQFDSSDIGDIKAIFSAESADELNNLKAAFERSTLDDVQVSIDTEKLQLNLSASAINGR